MRKLLLLFITVNIVVAGGFAQADSWKKFSPKEKDFVVEVPGDFKVLNPTIEGSGSVFVRSAIYQYKDNDSEYVISIAVGKIDFPTDSAFIDKLGSTGKIDCKNRIYKSMSPGSPRSGWVGTDCENGRSIDQSIYIKGNRMLIATGVCRAKAQCDHFMKSLKVH